ncbi:hypothetical protein SCAR479_04374 [Seiridium cardinale]|uniref:Uncharacterized protein n=1 Tax=Seiridium cardinale TaxID=138064 RepID=A0ABR2XYP1_9PEZI
MSPTADLPSSTIGMRSTKRSYSTLSAPEPTARTFLLRPYKSPISRLKQEARRSTETIFPGDFAFGGRTRPAVPLRFTSVRGKDHIWTANTSSPMDITSLVGGAVIGSPMEIVSARLTDTSSLMDINAGSITQVAPKGQHTQDSAISSSPPSPALGAALPVEERGESHCVDVDLTIPTNNSTSL